jgi:hypothetical protein
MWLRGELFLALHDKEEVFVGFQLKSISLFTPLHSICATYP